MAQTLNEFGGFYPLGVTVSQLPLLIATCRSRARYSRKQRVWPGRRIVFWERQTHLGPPEGALHKQQPRRQQRAPHSLSTANLPSTTRGAGCTGQVHSIVPRDGSTGHRHLLHLLGPAFLGQQLEPSREHVHGSIPKGETPKARGSCTSWGARGTPSSHSPCQTTIPSLPSQDGL